MKCNRPKSVGTLGRMRSKSVNHPTIIWRVIFMTGIVPVVMANAASPTTGSAPMIFPHFAQGGGYQTTFTFSNLSTTATAVTISYFAQSGGLLKSDVLSLSALGSATQRMSNATLTVGWARVVANPAANVAATETIQLFDAAGALVGETSTPPGQPDTTLRLPVYEMNGFSTGVAFVNTGSADASITFTVRNSGGATVAVSNVYLGASQQMARFTPQLANVSNLEGTLEITSNAPLAAVALRIHSSTGIFSTVQVAPSPPEAYFSPRVGTSARIVQEIQRAQASIDVAIYSFTRNDIGDALIAAKGRGVPVRVIADAGEAGAEISRLEASGIAVKRTSGGGGGIMHNKYAVFDSHVVLTGSFNWTNAAENDNDENAVFLHDPLVVSAYQSSFASMWAVR
jgi:hypothetical protein